MPVLCWSIVDWQFCACIQGTTTWLTNDIYIELICSFLDSFPIEFIAEGWAKYPGLNIRFFMRIYSRYRFLCICVGKEGNNDFVLSITDRDFSVHVRGSNFCLFGRKKGQRFVITDKDFWAYVSPDLLIQPCFFTFSWSILFVFEFSESLLWCKLVPLYLFFYFA